MVMFSTFIQEGTDLSRDDHFCHICFKQGSLFTLPKDWLVEPTDLNVFHCQAKLILKIKTKQSVKNYQAIS